MEDELDEQRFI